ncbi:baseplate J/gp47 family protein [Anaerocolumna xylanovorans]|uniref:Phage-related baseplate assembly protein n=1 Tax=Anaerocolumna xylanovorans DSM 12503 TaxID=1121345 RepID=A0A1M7YBU4_9FIRM|nr:baseplate J/gp47 family protein [Anaerocolumna xylanovorans]SHO50061.1 Phage-related baseplate assembly protein [Anaerocolumna xylanovorans DSM 12503]
MANEIQKLYDLPDISFIDDITFDDILAEMVSDYETEYENQTGQSIVLRPGDKEHIQIRIEAAQYYQMYLKLDNAAKMNLLKYSKGDFLKHLGAFKKTFIQEPKAAILTARFTLSEVRREVIYIPRGTRITAGDGIYFETDDYAEITAGDSFVDIDCTCQTVGTVGNDYIIGQIETIVDPVPYVASVSNVTKSTGGAGEETEESFRENIFMAPSSYSTAGPSDAYEYWVKQYNSASIEDVKIYEPDDAVVDIRILLLNGELPSETFCSGALEYIKENPIVPMTDKTTVKAPDVVKYDLKATYYIARSDVNNIASIQSSIEAAKDTFINWQRTKIGRDINPDALTEFVRAAGGKRVVITSPVFTKVPETSVANEETIEFVYGGVEDD